MNAKPDVFSSPLGGEVARPANAGEVSRAAGGCIVRAARTNDTPTPDPSPQGGGGSTHR